MEGVEMRKDRRRRRRIVMLALPLQGHVTPMLNLADILDSKGFSISIIHTRYNSIDPTPYPHLSFHILEDGLPPDSTLTSNHLNTVLSAIQLNCALPFHDCLSHILTDPSAIPVACLISDPMYSFAASVAHSFNLPCLVLRTGGISAFLVYDSLPTLRLKGYYPLQADRLDEEVPELAPLKVKDLPAEVQHHILATTVKQTKMAQGVICNTFDELEHSSIATVQLNLSYPIFPIGPLHKYSQTTAATLLQPDLTCVSWLNTQKPNTVLYVSFGSIAVITPTEFLEIAWGLANSCHPFLWVVRPGLTQGFQLTQLLPPGYEQMVGDRGKIVEWAPQLKVLSHPAVAGFWTHCGWNSTMESISQGVPMLCLPFFADQAVNARHICDNWKIGVRLENKTRQNIQTAITKLMADAGVAEMRIRITALKEKAELCLQKDGSSYQSLEALTNYLSSL